MTFFFADLCGEIDWSKRPRFRDKELAGIHFGAATGSMVADKLFEVCLVNGSRQWVLIHIEVQAQRDNTLARRILDYNYRILKEYEQPVASLVVLADEEATWRPDAFHSRVLGTVMGISFATAKLQDFADRTEELVASPNPFAWLTLAHLRTQQTQHDSEQRYVAKWQLTKLMFQHGWKKTRIIAMFRVINWMMALPESLQQRYWQAVIKFEKEQKMEWITPLEQMFLNKGLQTGIKQGLKQGIEQGIEQGRKEEALALLERQLARRFGPLSKTTRARLAKANLTQLRRWNEVLPDAKSLKQLFET